MTDRNRTTGARIARLPTAVLLVVCALVVAPGTTSAAPSRQDVEDARARLAQLNEQQSLVDEEYNQARLALDGAERRLSSARAEARTWSARATAARRELARRAHFAYEAAGSQIGVLLGAENLTEFSDRLEFMDQVAASDADAVARAQVALQRARWATRQLRSAVAQREDAFASVRDKRAELEEMVGEQQALISQLEQEVAEAEARAAAARQREEEARQRAREQQQSQPPATQPPSTSPPSTEPSAPPTTEPPAPPAPPPNESAAQIAISAAKSVLGVPYQYGGASPETGFDCSGLTMWAYAHAGISLPHSSAMQYASLPHVSQSELQPGDLLFFYTPIHHVAIYLGGGQMIHAPHTGSYVQIIPVYWEYYVGAARPT